MMNLTNKRRVGIKQNYFLLFLVMLIQILLISSSSPPSELYINMSNFAARDSSKYLRNFTSSLLKWRMAAQQKNNYERTSFGNQANARRSKTQTYPLSSDIPIGGGSKSATKTKFDQNIPRRDVNRREIQPWDESCLRDRPDNTSLPNSVISLWKYDLYTLQACDVYKPGNETSNVTITTPQATIIMNGKYSFRNKNVTDGRGKKVTQYCDPSSTAIPASSNSRETVSSRDFDSLCSSRRSSLEFNAKWYTLPFCNHLTVADVTQANPDVAKHCTVFEKNGSSTSSSSSSSSREACQTCSIELLRLDKLARLGYCALESILERADCKIPYSPTSASCETCRNAYRIWLCAQFFGKLRIQRNESDDQSVATVTLSGSGEVPSYHQSNSNKNGSTDGYVYRYPCQSLCHNVMKMCPYSNPIWDIVANRPGMIQLEPVEYSGWPAFHCPTTLPPYIDENEPCYYYNVAENGELKLEMGQHRQSSSPSALQISFHVLLISILSSATYIV